MQNSGGIDFTIITPVFNGAEWIEETILSVLKHCAGLRFEYIVINDGSTDNTLEILTQYDDRLILINQDNQGEASSVNTGFYKGKGRYVLVVSADDPMRSQDLLRQAMEIMDCDQDIVCVYPDWSMINQNSEIIREIVVEEFSMQKLVGEYICIVGPGGVFRRTSALEINGRNPMYRYTSDYDFWLRLAQLGRFQRIPQPLAFWRKHPESTSIAERGNQMGRERISVMRNFLNTTTDIIPKKMARSAMCNAYYQAALLIYFDTSVPAKRWMLRAVQLNPMRVLKFDLRVVLYIALFPLSPKILGLLTRIGVAPRLPDHA
jgi:glycosyltransferase involved in cell wall biosynthesis